VTPLFLDLESFSAADLRKVGAQKYARDPSTEIIVAQWAIGDEEPHVADCTGRHKPDELVALLEDPQYTIVAHNGGGFDRLILRGVWGVDILPERWLDTMVCAYAHSLPGSLDKVGDALGLDAAHLKDKRGNDLIRLFCLPRPKNMKLRRATRDTHPEEWAAFLEYSRQDIVAMRAIHAKLPTWNFHIGHPEHALWCLDQRMNDRGFLIDTALAAGAIAATGTEKLRLNDEMSDETDGLVPSASKRDALLSYILFELCFELPNLKASTLRELIGSGELPSEVERLLELRLEATKTSTAKYKAALNAACDDGRVRGAMQFGGAQRTMRWAGRLTQPQNFPRPSREYSVEEYDDICKAIANGTVMFV
jgi:DNA polymerase bacteriophage-type